MSRRQADEALVMRLISVSIAATAMAAVRAAIKPSMAAERHAVPFAGSENLVGECGGERAS